MSCKRLLVFALAFSAVSGRLAAEAPLPPQDAQQVFSKASNSIFLVEMRTVDGKVLSSGTAFLIAPKKLLTNAHVVQDGFCSIRIGPARLTCKTEKLDGTLDLALITLETELEASPLIWAKVDPVVGATVFVISNPLGLEKTISQGLFNGFRAVDGAQAMQLSAPVSPGSSGGPVLNSAGEVIGVIVGSMKSGQLVNFAIPAKLAAAFVTGENELKTFQQVMDRIDASLNWNVAKRDANEIAEWNAELRVLVRRGMALAKTSDELVKLANSPISWVDVDVAIEVARKAQVIRGGESSRLLAQLLLNKGDRANDAQRKTILDEALTNANLAIKQMGSTETSLYTLASIQKALDLKAEAYRTLASAATLPEGRSERVITDLCVMAAANGKLAEAEKLIEELRAKKANGLTLTFLASSLSDLGAYRLAGLAYDLSAGSGLDWLASDWCSAAEAWWKAGEADEALSSARACMKAVKPGGNEDSSLAYANRLIASILLGRGVKDEALLYARQSVDLNKSDPFAFAVLADVLIANDRNTEAVDAAKTAIRLSDGKFASTHSSLGSAFFKLKRWPEAREAYKQAAELEKTNASAPFNVALTLVNENRNADAVYWLEESLRRNPAPELKSRVQNLLKIIR